MKKKTILALLIFYLFPLFLTGEVLFLGPDSFSCNDIDFIAPTFSTLVLTNYFYAPIQLPEGSKIRSMAVFYKNDIDSCDLRVKIVRKNRYSNSYPDIILDLLTTESSETYRITKVTNVNWSYNKILNNVCTYHVAVEFSKIGAGSTDETLFYGVKIFYKLPTT